MLKIDITIDEEMTRARAPIIRAVVRDTKGPRYTLFWHGWTSEITPEGLRKSIDEIAYRLTLYNGGGCNCEAHINMDGAERWPIPLRYPQPRYGRQRTTHSTTQQRQCLPQDVA